MKFDYVLLLLNYGHKLKSHNVYFKQLTVDNYTFIAVSQNGETDWSGNTEGYLDVLATDWEVVVPTQEPVPQTPQDKLLKFTKAIDSAISEFLTTTPYYELFKLEHTGAVGSFPDGSPFKVYFKDQREYSEDRDGYIPPYQNIVVRPDNGGSLSLTIDKQYFNFLKSPKKD